MSTLAEVKIAAEQILGEALPRGSVEQVSVEESLDEEGAPALRILALVKPEAVANNDEVQDAQLDAKADLQQRLSSMGEERFAYVRLVTAEELDVES